MEETENKELKLVEKYINQTNRNIFLTGKAGTGKTTFLRQLKTSTQKSFVIAAPTGIAALNAGGVTLHSLFNLPNALFLPESATKQPLVNIITQQHVLKSASYSTAKLELLKNLELLVIDEVSMLRADLLDMIDLLLRQLRSELTTPFGGLQVLFIGDLFQLSPVLGSKEEVAFSAFYPSPYFFDSNAVRQSDVVYIELHKVYRQSDLHFIELLNKIRHNEIEQKDLDELNRKIFLPSENSKKQFITLTSHISKVDEINARKLLELGGEAYSFPAQVTGKFDHKNFPGEAVLHIKPGAQVMVTKNDPSKKKRYYNGKIGQVHKISEEGISLIFSDSIEPVMIQKETWKNIAYGFENEKATTTMVGELKQFPIRLAWAVTIHKSQGLSFDQAVIDAADSFSEGQVYVALSRLTNFEGLYLASPLSKDILKQNETVVNYIKECEKSSFPESLLQQETSRYIFELLMNCFNWNFISDHIRLIIRQVDSWRIANKFEKLVKTEEIDQLVAQQQEISLKLIRQLSDLTAVAIVDYSFLFQRVKAARDYFTGVLDNKLSPLVSAVLSSAASDKDQKEFLQSLTKMDDLIYRKKVDLSAAEELAKGLLNGIDVENLLLNYENAKRPAPGPPQAIKAPVKHKLNSKQATQLKSLEYFRNQLTIPEIAAKRQLAIHVIESHITELIKAGAIKLQEVLPEEKISFLLPLIANGNVDINELRVTVGNAYSFFELRAAINHVIRNS
ncbi:helix-turn-helix domain-containing protein [Mucilaginibacter agri]|uniref:AAA family ATPase n=1 Tax=Mucilaginibacter agri TaxID=2695265 RepID=A0A966DQI5_9SPHI|nr:helix-turn-helix domain-containing protein [Mucilaginibacter agri]NCD68048.1 AAA family ATPase [Mucilaginibacter agri]